MVCAASTNLYGFQKRMVAGVFGLRLRKPRPISTLPAAPVNRVRSPETRLSSCCRTQAEWTCWAPEIRASNMRMVLLRPATPHLVSVVLSNWYRF